MLPNSRRLLGFALAVALIAGLGSYVYFKTQPKEDPGATPSTAQTISGSQPKPSQGTDATATGDPQSKSGTTPLQRRLMYVNPEYPRAFEIDEQTPVPQGPVAPLAAELWRKADNGDAYAGYVAFLAINRCLLAQRKRAPGESVDPDLLDKDLDDCKDVSAADIRRAYQTLRRSAEQGDIESLLLYPVVGASELDGIRDALRDPQRLVQYREDYRRFLERAASMGSIEALGNLSHAYSAGVMIDSSPTLAYAYAYAQQMLRPSAATELQPILDILAKPLTPQQIRAAQESAAQIASRCCK